MTWIMVCRSLHIRASQLVKKRSFSICAGLGAHWLKAILARKCGFMSRHQLNGSTGEGKTPGSPGFTVVYKPANRPGRRGECGRPTTVRSKLPVKSRTPFHLTPAPLLCQLRGLRQLEPSTRACSQAVACCQAGFGREVLGGGQQLDKQCPCLVLGEEPLSLRKQPAQRCKPKRSFYFHKR